jgi:hypothetical protein
MKKKIDISGAMAAEAALAREEMKGLEGNLEKSLDGLPDNHPLKILAQEELSKLDGDLSGLPPNHPLLLAMQEAKLRYDENERYAQEVAVYEKEQQEIKIKRAKKLDAKRVADEKRRRQAERETVIRSATKRINSSMDETMDSLKRLRENIEASQEDFVGDRYALMKLDRLNRLILAAMKGVSDSKINAGRVVSNGR